MTAAYWIIVAAVVVVAAGWLLWARLRPRVRPLSTDERIRAADEDEWQRQALENVTEDGERS